MCHSILSTSLAIIGCVNLSGKSTSSTKTPRPRLGPQCGCRQPIRQQLIIVSNSYGSNTDIFKQISIMTSIRFLPCTKLRNYMCDIMRELLLLSPFYRWGIIYFSRWLLWAHQLIQQNWDGYKLKCICFLLRLSNSSPMTGSRGRYQRRFSLRYWESEEQNSHVFIGLKIFTLYKTKTSPFPHCYNYSYC